MYTVAEVAKILRVKKAYVYELVAQDRLRAPRLSARRIRIPAEALEEFVRQEAARPAANPYAVRPPAAGGTKNQWRG